jgi:hypothetical protein
VRRVPEGVNARHGWTVHESLTTHRPKSYRGA